jgi:acetyl-CoA carboxylase alpha subunit
MATCTIVETSSRPYTLDHVRALCGDTFLNFTETEALKMIKPMIGLGKNWWSVFMIVGQQKDITQRPVTETLGWQTRRDRKLCV